MLPSYYKHVCQYENSLVTRFYGVHCVKPVGGQKVFHLKSFDGSLFVSRKFTVLFFTIFVVRLGLSSWETCSAQSIESRDGLTSKGHPMDVVLQSLKVKSMRRRLSRTLISILLSAFRETGIKSL